MTPDARWRALRRWLRDRRRQYDRLASMPKPFNPNWDRGAFWVATKALAEMSRLSRSGARARTKGRTGR